MAICDHSIVEGCGRLVGVLVGRLVGRLGLLVAGGVLVGVLVAGGVLVGVLVAGGVAVSDGGGSDGGG